MLKSNDKRPYKRKTEGDLGHGDTGQGEKAMSGWTLRLA